MVVKGGNGGNGCISFQRYADCIDIQLVIMLSIGRVKQDLVLLMAGMVGVVGVWSLQHTPPYEH